MACCLSRGRSKQLFIIVVVLFTAILIISSIVYYKQHGEEVELVPTVYATVYMEEECGCCRAYIDYLENKGVEVNVTYVDREKLIDLKKELGIPLNLYSCHTTIIQDYIVEGHVPFHIIAKLVKEKPKILGIALPGMIPGSPGMGGKLKEPLTIYAFTEDAAYVYMQTMQTD